MGNLLIQQQRPHQISLSLLDTLLNMFKHLDDL